MRVMSEQDICFLAETIAEAIDGGSVAEAELGECLEIIASAEKIDMENYLEWNDRKKE